VSSPASPPGNYVSPSSNAMTTLLLVRLSSYPSCAPLFKPYLLWAWQWGRSGYRPAIFSRAWPTPSLKDLTTQTNSTRSNQVYATSHIGWQTSQLRQRPHPRWSISKKSVCSGRIDIGSGRRKSTSSIMFAQPPLKWP